jgi:hypothetical protein
MEEELSQTTESRSAAKRRRIEVLELCAEKCISCFHKIPYETDMFAQIFARDSMWRRFSQAGPQRAVCNIAAQFVPGIG